MLRQLHSPKVNLGRCQSPTDGERRLLAVFAELEKSRTVGKIATEYVALCRLQDRLFEQGFITRVEEVPYNRRFGPQANIVLLGVVDLTEPKVVEDAHVLSAGLHY